MLLELVIENADGKLARIYVISILAVSLAQPQMSLA